MRSALLVAAGGALGSWAREVRAIAAIVLAGVCVASCGPNRADRGGTGELETVDVTAQPDAGASLEGDSAARPVGVAAVGTAALPAGFPPEVPLPSPSSLVESAAGARELRLTLAIDLPAEVVRSTYLRQLAAAGFEELPDGAFAGHGRSLRFTATTAGEVTRLTIRVARP